jgi:hypothetical protein
MGIHLSIGPRSWVRASLLLACLSSVSPAGAQSQRDSVSYGPPTSQQLSTEALAFGPVADSNNPFGNITFDKRWLEGPLPGAANQAPSWDSSSALGYAGSPKTGSSANGPTSLPAESGVNYTLSPFAGYFNAGSGLGSQAVGGGTGSVAFPIGHSFGLFTEGTAGSIGGYGFYQGGTNLYWRDPSLGLVGATGQVGHLNTSFGDANFASGGANFEGYFGRFTPFATAGAFGVQSLKAAGYGTIGTAYYPTDNLQLALSGIDYGGSSGVQGGIEYLLPEKVQGIATTVSVDGFLGNHGMSGAMARFTLLFGPKTANNKTLIERRRQDDPISDNQMNDPLLFHSDAYFQRKYGGPAAAPGQCLKTGQACSASSQCCVGGCSLGECVPPIGNSGIP